MMHTGGFKGLSPLDDRTNEKFAENEEFHRLVVAAVGAAEIAKYREKDQGRSLGERRTSQ